MMYQRFFRPPGQSYFLFGPRGTGKSTWLKQHYADAYWVDFINPESFRYFSARPEALQPILEEYFSELGDKHPRVVVIDEVQKIPQILDVVHILIEQKKGYQFILTGSSARQLKKHGVNLLGGRALLRHMSPFYAAELGDSFNLDRNIRLGMLPLVLDALAPEEVLRAYAGIYLKEEVQAEGIVRNVGDFARFLEAMSFSHGSLINAANIARECHVARKTVDGYLLILEDLLLSFQLSVFRSRAKRALVQHAKFYFFDSGVYHSLRPQGVYDQKEERMGTALEGLVAQHLRAWINDQAETYQLQFWRTSSQVEVDFIVYGPNCFLAIEVKNGEVLHPSDFRGLETFCEDYPEAKPILLYRGKQRLRERGVLCYPVDEFLMQINPCSALPESASVMKC